ncbi:hypothetical protein [Alteromonas macleodii]|uniref:hypothetical protein n=1 Tax=Alteromonas macleodii TaxID=28108 RepID=UPI000A497788|nr:hypothetical protein [Alteromonas macleodii]
MDRSFARAGIELDIAQKEFAEWVYGLDGELDNEYTQNELAAEEAIEELLHARD